MINNQLTHIQTTTDEIDAGVIIIDASLNLIQTERRYIQNDIPNIEIEFKQLNDDYEQNKKRCIRNKRQNKLIAKKYEEAFNIANLNHMKIQQTPNESEEDF